MAERKRAMNEEAKIKELKAATRAANEALADLKAERKACEKLVKDTLQKLEDLIRIEVEKQVDALGEATQDAIDKTQKRIFKKFDELAAILLGEDEKDKESIPELIERRRAHGTLPIKGGFREAPTKH